MAAPTDAQIAMRRSGVIFNGPSPTTKITPIVPRQTARLVLAETLAPKNILLATTVINGTKELIVAKYEAGKYAAEKLVKANGSALFKIPNADKKKILWLSTKQEKGKQKKAGKKYASICKTYHIKVRRC